MQENIQSFFFYKQLNFTFRALFGQIRASKKVKNILCHGQYDFTDNELA
jgi:hypothetical protein